MNGWWWCVSSAIFHLYNSSLENLWLTAWAPIQADSQWSRSWVSLGYWCFEPYFCYIMAWHLDVGAQSDADETYAWVWCWQTRKTVRMTGIRTLNKGCTNAQSTEAPHPTTHCINLILINGLDNIMGYCSETLYLMLIQYSLQSRLCFVCCLMLPPAF